MSKQRTKHCETTGLSLRFTTARNHNKARNMSLSSVLVHFASETCLYWTKQGGGNCFLRKLVQTKNRRTPNTHNNINQNLPALSFRSLPVNNMKIFDIFQLRHLPVFGQHTATPIPLHTSALEHMPTQRLENIVHLIYRRKVEVLFLEACCLQLSCDFDIPSTAVLRPKTIGLEMIHILANELELKRFIRSSFEVCTDLNGPAINRLAVDYVDICRQHKTDSTNSEVYKCLQFVQMGRNTYECNKMALPQIFKCIDSPISVKYEQLSRRQQMYHFGRPRAHGGTGGKIHWVTTLSSHETHQERMREEIVSANLRFDSVLMSLILTDANVRCAKISILPGFRHAINVPTRVPGIIGSFWACKNRTGRQMWERYRPEDENL